MHDIIVIGAGSSGLMAASAAFEKSRVLILEKMHKAGMKLRLSGGGRCNLTHNVEDWTELLTGYGSGGNFLCSVFSRFGPKELIDFFYEIGIPTKADRGGRIFPRNENANEVVEKLLAFLRKNKVEIKYNQRVIDVALDKSGLWEVLVKNNTYYAKRIIVATGGASYPGTGSTGDGYRILAKLEHKIIPPKPSLVPLNTKEEWVKSLKGLTLKNVEVNLLFDGRKIISRFGDMIFTHFGISGPVILYLSREAVNLMDKGKVEILINLKPALNQKKLKARLERDFVEFSRKTFKNSLTKLLPASLIPVIVELSGILPDKAVSQITGKEKKILLNLLQNLRLTVTSPRSFYEAEVTSGGVVLAEVNPKTMESKKNPGLFLCGEILDIDGFIGGYNLQAAFSTGWMAGRGAASSI